ncbi:MAG: NAD(P)/FAD-dependent oxidoreductase, partial [Cytophagia bacterium]|nr:NAD(P)/FAD-dependent oxidoreductase [Cytophagia bacterium]
MKTDYDVLIVGGSYAGLSAAMALGRSLRKVLIIDSGLPCNRQTPHSHNFITQDGNSPAQIAALAKQQVLKYPTIGFENGLVIKGKAVDKHFEIELSNGKVFTSKKLLFTTGVKDVMPAI